MRQGARALHRAGRAGDRDRRVHDANIFDLNSKYAEIWASDEALEYLGQTSAQRPT